MTMMPWLADRSAVAEADELMRVHGADAVLEAAARADRSRDKGNHIHFCRWRQIERLICMLSLDRSFGTIH